MLDALIIGADGKIGNNLYERLSKQYNVLGTSRRSETPFYQFDLGFTDHIFPAKITYICAGITRFNDCARDEKWARRVNVWGVCRVAKHQIENNGKVVFLSSCAAETHVDSVYGKLKLEVENKLLKYKPNVACVRFGPVLYHDRVAYSDGPYQPIEMNLVIDRLANFIVNWEPGLTRWFNGKIEKEMN